MRGPTRYLTSGLSERLRDQVYEHTVLLLAAAFAARHEGISGKAALEAVYHAGLTDTNLSGAVGLPEEGATDNR